jgi:hypothetical protein
MKAITTAEDLFWKNVPKEGGVYKIQCIQNKKPIKINRVLGIDDQGILYIGKSVNLRERLRILKRSLNQKTKVTGHTFGKKYFENKKLEKIFPLNSLYVSFITTSEPKTRETELLNKYFAKFGEVPPFNSSK